MRARKSSVTTEDGRILPQSLGILISASFSNYYTQPIDFVFLNNAQNISRVGVATMNIIKATFWADRPTHAH